MNDCLMFSWKVLDFLFKRNTFKVAGQLFTELLSITGMTGVKVALSKN